MVTLRDAPIVASLVASLAGPLGLGAAALAGGCASARLPEPIREPPCFVAPCRAAHEGEDPVPVPFPPPPAKVDVVGAPPPEMTDPVWVDGQWEWRGRAWVWEPGQWWQRPVSQYWAAPAIVRRADGQLVWFAGKFRPYGPPISGAPAASASSASGGPPPPASAPRSGSARATPPRGTSGAE